MLHKRDKQIKACKYCHKKHAYVLFAPEPEGMRYRVVCGKCGAYTSRYKTKIKAVERWNDMFGEGEENG